jgi:hypothetical protein
MPARKADNRFASTGTLELVFCRGDGDTSPRHSLPTPLCMCDPPTVQVHGHMQHHVPSGRRRWVGVTLTVHVVPWLLWFFVQPRWSTVAAPPPPPSLCFPRAFACRGGAGSRGRVPPMHRPVRANLCAGHRCLLCQGQRRHCVRGLCGSPCRLIVSLQRSPFPLALS